MYLVEYATELEGCTRGTWNSVQGLYSNRLAGIYLIMMQLFSIGMMLF